LAATVYRMYRINGYGHVVAVCITIIPMMLVALASVLS
jgi:hypothetical protein